MKSRKCIRCGMERPLSDFHKQPQRKDGLHPYCKYCIKDDNMHRHIRKSELKEHGGSKPCKNCGQFEAANHVCKTKTQRVKVGIRFEKLVVIEFDKGTPSGNRWLCRCDCGTICSITASNLVRGQVSCGCTRKAWNRKYYGELSGLKWASIKSGAKARGHKLQITPEEAWQLFLDQERKCALTGVEITFKTHYLATDGTASLDRIDSNADYTIDNVQWIHKDVNRMKNTFPQDQFIDWCRKVAAYAAQTVYN